jgi:hypothetical protein
VKGVHLQDHLLEDNKAVRVKAHDESKEMEVNSVHWLSSNSNHSSRPTRDRALAAGLARGPTTGTGQQKERKRLSVLFV